MNAANVLPFRAPEPGPIEPALGAILDAYLVDQQSVLAPATYADRVRLCGRLRDTFGERKPSTLRPSELKAWILSRPEYAEDNTRWSVLNQVKRILNWAVNDLWLDRNPWRGVTLPEGEPRRQTTEDELQRMLRVSDPLFRVVLVFLRSAGCRPQIVRNADWEMVDWREYLIVLPWQKHKAGKRTRKPLRLLLFGAHRKLIELLARRVTTAGCTLAGPIFRNSRGKRWTLGAFTGRLKKLRKDAGLPMECTLHGLRHRFCTDLLAKGTPRTVVGRLAGHASPRTLDRYDHTAEDGDMLRDWAQRAQGRGGLGRPDDHGDQPRR